MFGINWGFKIYHPNWINQNSHVFTVSDFPINFALRFPYIDFNSFNLLDLSNVGSVSQIFFSDLFYDSSLQSSNNAFLQSNSICKRDYNYNGMFHALYNKNNLVLDGHYFPTSDFLNLVSSGNGWEFYFVFQIFGIDLDDVGMGVNYEFRRNNNILCKSSLIFDNLYNPPFSMASTLQNGLSFYIDNNIYGCIHSGNLPGYDRVTINIPLSNINVDDLENFFVNQDFYAKFGFFNVKKFNCVCPSLESICDTLRSLL